MLAFLCGLPARFLKFDRIGTGVHADKPDETCRGDDQHGGEKKSEEKSRVFFLSIHGDVYKRQLLSPEWTSYNRRVQYQTYDVTPMVHRGANTLSARLGKDVYKRQTVFRGVRAQPGTGR